MPQDTASGVYYEVHGEGRPLFLGFPLMASYGEIFGEAAAGVPASFLAGLTDRYRVVLADYPSIGRSRDIAPGDLTVHRVISDMLAVADAAGFERFAYWGYGGFGAAIGLELAARTDRLSALVAGGWSPLGAPYAGMQQAAAASLDNPSANSLKVLRSPAQYAQWLTFWSGLQDRDDAAGARIRCPGFAFAGMAGEVESGGVDIGYAAALKANRAALEALGWRVDLLEAHDHGVGLDARVMVPLVRGFLDEVLP
jgi:hypothetical protein